MYCLFFTHATFTLLMKPVGLRDMAFVLIKSFFTEFVNSSFYSIFHNGRMTFPYLNIAINSITLTNNVNNCGNNGLPSTLNSPVFGKAKLTC